MRTILATVIICNVEMAYFNYYYYYLCFAFSTGLLVIDCTTSTPELTLCTVLVMSGCWCLVLHVRRSNSALLNLSSIIDVYQSSAQIRQSIDWITVHTHQGHFRWRRQVRSGHAGRHRVTQRYVASQYRNMGFSVGSTKY